MTNMFRTTQLVALVVLLAYVPWIIARKPTLEERGIPKDAEGVMTITSPQGASIRFKQPGKQGICETKEGVDDYAGYISLNERTNMFFWFFEARENPSEKPVSTHTWTVALSSRIAQGLVVDALVEWRAWKRLIDRVIPR